MIANNLNVIDEYKNWEVADIKEDLRSRALPYAVMMQHIKGDYNISTLIRNANAFGAQRVYYYGRRKWDRRGSVGTHHYTDLIHLDDLEDIEYLKNKYHVVGVENNLRRAKDISEFHAQPNTLFIFGEEGHGIQENILDLCDEIIYVRQRGSVRSLNVGTCSGIIMNDYVTKLNTD